MYRGGCAKSKVKAVAHVARKPEYPSIYKLNNWCPTKVVRGKIGPPTVLHNMTFC